MYAIQLPKLIPAAGSPEVHAARAYRFFGGFPASIRSQCFGIGIRRFPNSFNQPSNGFKRRLRPPRNKKLKANLRVE